MGTNLILPDALSDCYLVTLRTIVKPLPTLPHWMWTKESFSGASSLHCFVRTNKPTINQEARKVGQPPPWLLDLSDVHGHSHFPLKSKQELNPLHRTGAEYSLPRACTPSWTVRWAGSAKPTADHLLTWCNSQLLALELLDVLVCSCEQNTSPTIIRHFNLLKTRPKRKAANYIDPMEV